MKYFSFVFVVLCFIVNYETFNLFRRKTVKIDKIIGSCPKYPNATILWNDIHIQKIQRTYVISAKIVVKTTNINDLVVECLLKRCSNRDAPDTCEKYQTMHIKKMCELLKVKNQPWTPFVDEIKPRMECPLTKGMYSVTNGTFDGDAFSALPIEGWYWKVEARLLDTVSKKVVMCIYLEGQIVPI